VVTPVKVARFTATVETVAVVFTTSMPLTRALPPTSTAAVAFDVMLKVSVPSPPTRLSPGFSVRCVAVKVSLRAVPVKAAPVSTPVVRV
jgi:hypothetical protein